MTGGFGAVGVVGEDVSIQLILFLMHFMEIIVLVNK